MGSVNIFLVILGLLFGVLLIIALLDTIRRRQGAPGYIADEPRFKPVDDESIVVERRYDQDTGEVTVVTQKEETATGDVISEERTYAADTGELTGLRVVEEEIEADGDVRIIEQTYDPETGAVTVLDHTRDSETGKVTDLKGETRANILGTLTEEQANEIIDIYEEGAFAAPVLRSEDPEKELPYILLDTNRRSLPNIVHVSSHLSYDGKVKPGRQPEEGEHHGIVHFHDIRNLEASALRSKIALVMQDPFLFSGTIRENIF